MQKRLPTLLHEIYSIEYFKSALNKFSVDESILPEHCVSAHDHLFLIPEIANLDIQECSLYFGKHKKKAIIKLEVDGREVYDNSDSYLLNNDFPRSEVCTQKDNHFYHFIDDSKKVEVHVFFSHHFNNTSITIESEPLYQELEREQNFKFKGYLIISGTGFFNLIVEKFPENEIGNTAKDINLELAEKLAVIRQRQESSIQNLNISGFYNRDIEIQTVYYSDEIAESLESHGVTKESTKVEIEANIRWYNDSSIIIDELLNLRLL